jgi:hypothetical protein
MHGALLVVTILACTCAVARAGERFTGFLTFGCGDSYIKIPAVSETWFVDLPERRQRQVFELANVGRDEYMTWWTFHVEIEGQVQRKPKRGYSFDHPRELIAERIIAARYPEVGESVQAATAPAKRFRGYLVLGEESAGFSPLQQGREVWWFVPGRVGWDQVGKYFPKPPQPYYIAVVEIFGRVGPPGAYGHLQVYDREIIMDEFTHVRPSSMSELQGTPGVGGPGSGKSDIGECKAQRR